jgi:hypothetical protein
MEQTVSNKLDRKKVQAGSKTFSLIANKAGNVVSYTLDALKRVKFSAKGFSEGGQVFLKAFGYDNGGMKYRFTLVHLQTKEEYPIWASNALKDEIAALTPYKESKNGNPYFKVPEESIAFYEVVDEETNEVGLIVGKRGEQDDAVVL